MDVAIWLADKQCFSIRNALTTDDVGGHQSTDWKVGADAVDELERLS